MIFRLTQDEYQALQTASSGARSLSDFARTKLLGSLGAPALDQQLLELSSTVARIAALLEKE
ncbi:MAG TPA: hypothetical protein VE958_01535 [Bryobacteraceae bacterium]|nr:hypothetical protein [Bryobacteraceae bacterium]